MMPSPSIDDRPRTNRSRSRSTGNARTRARSINFARPRTANAASQAHASPSVAVPACKSSRPNRFNPNSSSQPPRPNPHSARGTAAAPPTAISCLGAFWSPAASAVDRPVIPATKNLHRSRHAPTRVDRGNVSDRFDIVGLERLRQMLHKCTDPRSRWLGAAVERNNRGTTPTIPIGQNLHKVAGEKFVLHMAGEQPDNAATRQRHFTKSLALH